MFGNGLFKSVCVYMCTYLKWLPLLNQMQMPREFPDPSFSVVVYGSVFLDTGIQEMTCDVEMLLLQAYV